MPFVTFGYVTDATTGSKHWSGSMLLRDGVPIGRQNPHCAIIRERG